MRIYHFSEQPCPEAWGEQNASLRVNLPSRNCDPRAMAEHYHHRLDEWLLAAEYIMSEGNYNVVLCERGVRTFAQHTRNTLDLASIPAVRRISHLPVIVDPSHGTGRRDKVPPMGRAAIAAGADGLFFGNAGLFRIVRWDLVWPLVLIAIGVLFLVQRERR